MGIKKVYPVWVSLLGPDSGLKKQSTAGLSPSPLFVCLTLSAWLPRLCLSLPLHLPSISSPLSVVSLPLRSSLSRRDLVLTNRSCSRSLSGARTTPQTRVETGSSRSQSEAWKNGGRRGVGGWWGVCWVAMRRLSLRIFASLHSYLWQRTPNHSGFVQHASCLFFHLLHFCFHSHSASLPESNGGKPELYMLR